MIDNDEQIDANAKQAFADQDEANKTLRPPPIIIKDSSLLLDSLEPLVLTGETGQSRRPFRQRINGFKFVHALVYLNKEQMPLEKFDYGDDQGLTLRIWLQHFDENNGNWSERDLRRPPNFEMKTNERGALQIESTFLEEVDEIEFDSEYKYFYQMRQEKDRARIGQLEFLDYKNNRIGRPLKADENTKFRIEVWDAVRFIRSPKGFKIFNGGSSDDSIEH